MGVDADLTYLDERDQVRGRDPNLFYNPVTGYNLDPARFGRPNPAYGQVQWMESTGRTEALLLSSSLQRRFRNNFQGGLTYTRTLRRNDDTTGFGIGADNQFDLAGDWSRSQEFQRDTFRANGIVNLPYQMTVAGSYLYGSGTYYNASLSGRPFGKPGTNRLNIGAPIVIPAAVLDRWEGPAVIATNTAWPRNALRGMPLHKVDMRVLEPHRPGERRQRDAARRGVQRVQLEELRQLQHAARLDVVRAARGLVGQRLRAALGPARVPPRVLP